MAYTPHRSGLASLAYCHECRNGRLGDRGQIFQGDRMTAALLDRLTHRCTIFEMNGESYRFRQSMKTKSSKEKPDKPDKTEKPENPQPTTKES